MAWFIINDSIARAGVGCRRLRIKGPSGITYQFEVDQPTEVTEPRDIEFFADPTNVPQATQLGIQVPVIVPWEPQKPEERAAAEEAEEIARLKQEIENLRALLQQSRGARGSGRGRAKAT